VEVVLYEREVVLLSCVVHCHSCCVIVDTLLKSYSAVEVLLKCVVYCVIGI
jgi:hypothetical protein